MEQQNKNEDEAKKPQVVEVLMAPLVDEEEERRRKEKPPPTLNGPPEQEPEMVQASLAMVQGDRTALPRMAQNIVVRAGVIGLGIAMVSRLVDKEHISAVRLGAYSFAGSAAITLTLLAWHAAYKKRVL